MMQKLLMLIWFIASFTVGIQTQTASLAEFSALTNENKQVKQDVIQQVDWAWSGNPTAPRLQDAFANRRSNIQVKGQGIVVKILADDFEGSRHQRFIIKLSSGQTLLIAHNIDLAPRVNDLQIGDFILFYGEYEWNPQGGVIHWTHRDRIAEAEPHRQGDHVAGWIEHQGKRYQ
jgi:hypothetical protein